MNVLPADQPIDPHLWDRPPMRVALARRDISEVYRLLGAAGECSEPVAERPRTDVLHRSHAAARRANKPAPRRGAHHRRSRQPPDPMVALVLRRPVLGLRHPHTSQPVRPAARPHDRVGRHGSHRAQRHARTGWVAAEGTATTRARWSQGKYSAFDVILQATIANVRSSPRERGSSVFIHSYQRSENDRRVQPSPRGNVATYRRGLDTEVVAVAVGDAHRLGSRSAGVGASDGLLLAE